MTLKSSFGRVATGALLLASSAHAARNTNMPEPCAPPPVCCETPPAGPYAFAVVPGKPVSCPQAFNMSAAALILQAKEDGLEFAIRNENGSDLPISNGQIIGFSDDHRDWHYNAGVRVNVGFDLARDDWNLGFTWTWLNVANYRGDNAGASATRYYPLWSPPYGGVLSFNPFTTQTAVSAVWKTHYDTLDASLAKSYLVSRYLDLTTYFGVRSAWIYQKYTAHYAGIFIGDKGGAIMRSWNDFNGVGPRMGVQSAWRLGKGWNLFGNVAGSLLFGYFDVKQNMAVAQHCEDDGYELDSSFFQNTPNLEIELGINWGHQFLSSDSYISFSAAYEFHEWWGQNNLRRFQGYVQRTGDTQPSMPTLAELQNDSVSHGDLTLNGFSFTLSLEI